MAQITWALKNNVTYNNIGHCFFLEDGVEHDKPVRAQPGDPDQVSSGRAVRPDKPRCSRRETSGREWPAGQGRPASPSDNTASTFWITNPDNIYRDNVAAGSDSNGFWMSLPEHPNGKFADTEISAKTWPRRTPFQGVQGQRLALQPTTRLCSTETLRPITLWCYRQLAYRP